MYYINLTKRIYFEDLKKASVITGIEENILKSILCGKRGCSKLTAYVITKYYDENAEILDHFEFEREE